MTGWWSLASRGRSRKDGRRRDGELARSCWTSRKRRETSAEVREVGWRRKEDGGRADVSNRSVFKLDPSAGEIRAGCILTN